MSTLWPPIASVADRLFTPSESLLRRIAERDPSVLDDVRNAIESDDAWRAKVDAYRDEDVRDDAADLLEVYQGEVTIDASVEDCIARLTQFRQSAFDKAPRAGQIVRVERAVGADLVETETNVGIGLAVLLSAPTDIADVWVGWLVTSEASYAASWDLLLQDEDEPFHPSSCMVQTWNVVHVYVPTIGTVLAQLKEARLDAARALALEAVSGYEDTRAASDPGRIVTRRISSGHVMETGTPLSGPDDPRWRYQQLYFAAAEMVRMSARHATERAPVPVIASGVFNSVLRQLRPIRDFLSPTSPAHPRGPWNLAGADHQGRTSNRPASDSEVLLIEFEPFSESSPAIELVAVVGAASTSVELRGLDRNDAASFSSLKIGEKTFPLQLDNRRLVVIGHQLVIRRSLALALDSDAGDAICLI